MTYKEAYKIVEAALLENCGWFPADTFDALDKLEEGMQRLTFIDDPRHPVQGLVKPPELQSGVAIQTYLDPGQELRDK